MPKTTCPAGWVAGENENNANSASVEVEVEVEAELGNLYHKSVVHLMYAPHVPQMGYKCGTQKRTTTFFGYQNVLRIYVFST